MFHLQMIRPEQFRALRNHLASSGFTETAIRQRLKIPPEKPLDIVALATRVWSRDVVDALDALIHLFVLGEALAGDKAADLFPGEAWEAVQDAGIVLSDKEGASWLSTVTLFPVRGLFFAADRWTNIDHSIRPTFADIVYPAMTKSAKQYLDYLSFAPCEDFLELFAGTAPAALLAARNVKQSWATDITERSLDFARFNAALNNIHNVAFAQGDLFGAVDGQLFDRIAAHPPYMPVLQQAEIYSAGGALGEDLAKRMIAELPGRLKPGGRLYCRTLGIDRQERNFEETVRNWLGEPQQQFDVGVFVFDVLQPRRFIVEHTLNRDGGREQLAKWEKVFEENAVKQLLALVLVIQRVGDERPPFTLRRIMRDHIPASVMEWALAWETAVHSPGFLETLLHAKPAASSGTEVNVKHVVRDGALSAEEFRISLMHPFEVDWRVQPWMPLLLPQCDGKRTVSELFTLAKQNDWILADTPAREFCRVVADLIGGGFLRLDSFRSPGATE